MSLYGGIHNVQCPTGLNKEMNKEMNKRRHSITTYTTALLSNEATSGIGSEEIEEQQEAIW